MTDAFVTAGPSAVPSGLNHVSCCTQDYRPGLSSWANFSQSRRDGTIKSPARKCRVIITNGSSPGRDGTERHSVPISRPCRTQFVNSGSHTLLQRLVGLAMYGTAEQATEKTRFCIRTRLLVGP